MEEEGLGLFHVNTPVPHTWAVSIHPSLYNTDKSMD